MDSPERRYTKADLLHEIDDAWSTLTAALDGLTDAQMTDVRDAAGWAVTDHLVHIAAWERSVVVFLQGQPRHVGLGIEEHLYQTGDEDAINAAIQRQRQDSTAAAAVAELRAVHAELLHLLAPLHDDDLYQASSTYQPADTDELDARPIIGMIYSNTANHFREHQAWITRLVAADHVRR
jgi:hypothetical protein